MVCIISIRKKKNILLVEKLPNCGLWQSCHHRGGVAEEDMSLLENSLSLTLSNARTSHLLKSPIPSLKG